jgi:hypothetical protein
MHGRTRISLIVVCAASLATSGATSSRSGELGAPQGAPPAPMPAIRAIIAAMQEHPVVALGESHNLQEAGDFYVRLVRSDRFARAADDVVVEFGNARYQGVIDRYVNGRSVAPTELRRVWQDTTQVGAWDAPMYRRFFAAVRSGNAQRPRSERIRILLADPPIDWARVTSKAQVDAFLRRREQFMAHVIERSVLARGDRAVVIAGLAHVERSATPPKALDVTQLIDRAYPSAVWVVGIHMGFPKPAWESAISDWTVPSIASLQGTWIGLLPNGDGLAQDALNAMLYLGAPDALHVSVPLPSTYVRNDYWKTLKQRWPLGVGGSFSASKLFDPFRNAGYPGLFSRADIANLEAFAECMRQNDVESFPNPQFGYDSVGYTAASLAQAHKDPDFPSAFKACSSLLSG